jgi:ArsR family transcriptional regulator, virulence genes transcriptional regulator
MGSATAAKTAAMSGGLQALERKAAEVAAILGALANERRLMIVCRLVECGEANVTALAEAVGLSQSALSQHLARMRQEGLVTFRRDAQTLWYRIADPRVEQLFATLHSLFCQDVAHHVVQDVSARRKRK